MTGIINIKRLNDLLISQNKGKQKQLSLLKSTLLKQKGGNIFFLAMFLQPKILTITSQLKLYFTVFQCHTASKSSVIIFILYTPK